MELNTYHCLKLFKVNGNTKYPIAKYGMESIDLTVTWLAQFVERQSAVREV